MQQALRIKRVHNTKEMRAFRAKNGDLDKTCACDFCYWADKALDTLNVTVR